MIGTTSFKREAALQRAAARALRVYYGLSWGSRRWSAVGRRYWLLCKLADRAKRVQLGRIDAVEAERAAARPTALEAAIETAAMGRRLSTYYRANPHRRRW